MNVSLTPPVRLMALLGLLSACALGSAALLLARHHGGSSSSSASTPVPSVAHRASHAASAPRHGSRHHAASAPSVAPSTRVATTPAPAPAQKAAPVPAPVAADLRVPAAVAVALKTHDVVVAALYAPNAASDPTAVAEAQAGAQLAGAGFVKLDVLDEAVAKQLAKLAGDLSDPAVLVFRDAKGVAIRIDGFADREVVAQAAQNAASK